nr:uncharacterized protein LOC109730972 [Microcebus murinus]
MRLPAVGSWVPRSLPDSVTWASHGDFKGREPFPDGQGLQLPGLGSRAPPLAAQTADLIPTARRGGQNPGWRRQQSWFSPEALRVGLPLPLPQPLVAATNPWSPLSGRHRAPASAFLATRCPVSVRWWGHGRWRLGAHHENLILTESPEPGGHDSLQCTRDAGGQDRDGVAGWGQVLRCGPKSMTEVCPSRQVLQARADEEQEEGRREGPGRQEWEEMSPDLPHRQCLLQDAFSAVSGDVSPLRAAPPRPRPAHPLLSPPHCPPPAPAPALPTPCSRCPRAPSLSRRP